MCSLSGWSKLNKNILITGKSSRVGLAVQKWLAQWPDKYRIETISLRDGSWRKYDLSGFDVIFHVSGIAHVTMDPSMEGLFYKVNRDLTIETAKVAKKAGVKQFIFMSSGIVYGDSSDVGVPMIIDRNTKPNPLNFYGNSKLQAEEGLKKLEDENFKVVIIRSPALYGIGMKSHYNNLSDFARKHHFFPKVANQRSMLYNKNLAEFVRLMIDNEERGTFWPQNKEYTSTVGIVKDIAAFHGRSMILVPIPLCAVKLGAKRVPALKKAFGNFSYDQSISQYKQEYRLFSYEESIREIESSDEELFVEKKLM